MDGRARATGAVAASADWALGPCRWLTPEPAASNCPQLGTPSGRVTDARPCFVELEALSYGPGLRGPGSTIRRCQLPDAFIVANTRVRGARHPVMPNSGWLQIDSMLNSRWVGGLAEAENGIRRPSIKAEKVRRHGRVQFVRVRSVGVQDPLASAEFVAVKLAHT